MIYVVNVFQGGCWGLGCVSVNTPIRRYTDRCVYADTRYADRCVYRTFTVPYSQPQTNPKPTRNETLIHPQTTPKQTLKP